RAVAHLRALERASDIERILDRFQAVSYKAWVIILTVVLTLVCLVVALVIFLVRPLWLARRPGPLTEGPVSLLIRPEHVMSDTRQVPLFFSYTHSDERYRNKLDAHLSNLKCQGLIAEWHDRKITPGSEWRAEIDARLDSAEIILLLVSADFIRSDFCYSVEL